MFEHLYTPTDAISRSISHENPDGEPGKGSMATWGLNKSKDGKNGPARELDIGWKIDPWFVLPPHSPETEYAAVSGSGIIRSMWIVPGIGPEYLRGCIIRFYWDGCDKPAIECPFGDFFCAVQYEYRQVTTGAMCRNARTGYTSFIPMPFHTGFRMTVENLEDVDVTWGYQINYELCPIPEDTLVLHAQFNRSNPVDPAKGHTILNTVRGRGAYLGTYMYRGVGNNGRWSYGDVFFTVDGEAGPRSIGTDGYFGASDCFQADGAYRYYTTPEGCFMDCTNDNHLQPVKRFSMCRWHLSDPIYFEKELTVTAQAVGKRRGDRYLPLHDDISTAAFFYLDKPGITPKAPLVMDDLEVI